MLLNAAKLTMSKNAVDSLKKYAFAYESALPLELGKAGRLLSGAILKLPTINPADLPPLAKELTDTIAGRDGHSSLCNAASNKWPMENGSYSGYG